MCCTTCNDQGTRTISGGATDNTVDFGYAPVGGTIGNQVWHDKDGDGLYEPKGNDGIAGTADDESGMQGVTIDLYLDTNNNGLFDAGIDNLVRTTTTDINGQYEFTGLPAGKYLVDVAASNAAAGGVLEGFNKTTGATPGANDNSQADPYPVTLTSTGGVVSSNITADFGYDAPTPYSISGTVFNDLNSNGKDDGEPPLPGATVYLIRDLNGNGVVDPGEPVIGTMLSNASGDYLFTDLPNGTYVVTNDALDTQVNGFFQTTQLAAATRPAEPVTIKDANEPDHDFGYFSAPLDSPLTGAIGDRVWLDENGDGVQDAGEAGIPNLTVTLTGKDNKGSTVTLTTVTDANGGYIFSGLPPSDAGGYTITVTPPAGLNPTYDEDRASVTADNTTKVVLAAGVEHLTADFGYNWVPPADSSSPAAGATGAIGDRVWVDTNGNGVQDPGEPGLGGVTVTIYSDPDGNGVYNTPFTGATDAGGSPWRGGTTTTAADGSYVFDSLPPGSYVVKATLPAGYTQTGDPDGVKDNATTTPVVLAPGDVWVNADFGYQPAAAAAASAT